MDLQSSHGRSQQARNQGLGSSSPGWGLYTENLPSILAIMMLAISSLSHDTGKRFPATAAKSLFSANKYFMSCYFTIRKLGL